ncbi:MAG TPA: MBL fold metallo-hydrolase [Pyrinomonadaceae bacterium]|jgi:glyoxylase-like metal-dependent hydrolase (beta-lactamase superfamily II)/8-oxo-dGTP pyrophosphatase MutT (NUDIX family)
MPVNETPAATAAAAGAPRAKADAVPRDAAAVILVREVEGEPQVFWARRSERMAFLGGFYAFPGGQRDAEDAETPVENSADAEEAAMIACAARELFEELGVLVARGAEHLTRGQLASVLDDLTSARMTFPQLLAHYGLQLDARDFTYAGRWVTPPFSPRRFDTWFFLARCPRKQEPQVRTAEFESGEWTRAKDGVSRWEDCDALVAPPVLHALKVLREGLTEDLVERFLSVPQAQRQPVRRIEFMPGFICFPVRTPTKPPATHTNAYIVGHGELVILDPGSPDAGEQAELAACIDALLAEGRRVLEIILTHHHPDHVAGVDALRQHLGGRVRVAAHQLTADALRGRVSVDRFIEDGDEIKLAGEPALSLRAMHTPGHTRGHLSFYEERTGALITGDNILGLGSVLIDPPEGNMIDYLASLERYRALLPKIKVLFGGHGAAVASPRAKIEEYIAHRLEREEHILQAVRAGASSPPEIVRRVYTDVNPKAHALAERAVLAHLEKLEAEKLIAQTGDGNFVAHDANTRAAG